MKMRSMRRAGGLWWGCVTVGLLGLWVVGEPLRGAPRCVIVEGHPGEARFQESLESSAKKWQQSAVQAGYEAVRIAPGEAESEGDQEQKGSQIERLRRELAREPVGGGEALWLVLLGHGSAQGRVPRFALKGEDLGLDELVALLGKRRQPMVVVLGFSSAGAFVKPLAAADRVIVSATRSGEEENWSRFAGYFTEAMSGLEADADGDELVSVFEAWRWAVRAVERFYKEKGRLGTEHAVLEDVGTGRAVGVESFEATGEFKGKLEKGMAEPGWKARGTYLKEPPIERVLNEEERKRRGVLEERLARWRSEKPKEAGESYWRGLEEILLELADLYEGARQRMHSQ